jgi:archaellum component FlaF (FlaF/FlaG flagellin family)
MGFSIVISSAVIFISLFASLAIILSIVSSIYKTNDAIVNSAKVNSQINNTSIRISSITLDTNDRKHITITLNNDGKSKLFNYTYFDLIVTYDADINGNMTQVTEQLRYSDSSLSYGQWIISIQNDIVDPKILNPNEVAIIDAMLSNDVASNGRVIVTISTDNGSIATLAIQL